ncbi:myb/SANT-like DNA-binding domain-containing protein 4 isoform X1 [Ostrea edulis]|uniref:myb/SANT-like DNA-binding domain-containing protein 4 isoform X1 n=1 Tax=Ostrea edulis TaxID=37623 RepID=UPI0024AF90FE|nr:myb/SANT-like DNA-binding domain-containing protein 4 isoform X1 [Ostrea edulis]
METMKVKKKARAQNWTAEEEVLLIEEVKTRAEILFGPLKGCGKSGKIKEIKDREWQMVADKLNSQFDNKMRGLEEAKKKYYNIKQRSKEKLDSVKKPKTGGGPPLPPLTPGEETFLNLSVGQPNVHGLNGGVDSDGTYTCRITIQSQTFNLEVIQI